MLCYALTSFLVILWNQKYNFQFNITRIMLNTSFYHSNYYSVQLHRDLSIITNILWRSKPCKVNMLINYYLVPDNITKWEVHVGNPKSVVYYYKMYPDLHQSCQHTHMCVGSALWTWQCIKNKQLQLPGKPTKLTYVLCAGKLKSNTWIDEALQIFKTPTFTFLIKLVWKS